MKKALPVSLMTFGCVLLLAGCGPPAEVSFQSNARAKELLGDTNWSDAAGTVQFQFDTNAKLTGITADGLPAEIQDLNVNGQPFQLPIPPNEYIQDDSITVTMNHTKTMVSDDDTLTMEFLGTVEEYGAIVDHVTMTLTAQAAETENGAALSNLSGDVIVTLSIPFIGNIEYTIFSEQFDESIELTQAQ